MARSLAQVMRTVNVRLCDHLRSMLDEIDKRMEELDTRLTALSSQMSELKRLGLIYATEYWRPGPNGDYLYLHYPQVPGEPRRREYVGLDPDRIQSVREAIKRAKEFDRLQEEVRELERMVEKTDFHLFAAHEAIIGKYGKWL